MSGVELFSLLFLLWFPFLFLTVNGTLAQPARTVRQGKPSGLPRSWEASRTGLQELFPTFGKPISSFKGEFRSSLESVLDKLYPCWLHCDLRTEKTFDQDLSSVFFSFVIDVHGQASEAD